MHAMNFATLGNKRDARGKVGEVRLRFSLRPRELPAGCHMPDTARAIVSTSLGLTQKE
jgi:hypothetical protein